MNIIIYGPQGSGKGTQAKFLEKTHNFYHISTGDIMREEISKNTDLGKKIAEIINAGNLMTDDVTHEIVRQKILQIKKINNSQNIIFDGYPRNIMQLNYFFKNFSLDMAIELYVPEEVTIERLSSRRICSSCKQNYNIISLKPKLEGICDSCNSELIQRVDDVPDAIKKRLEIYKKDTLPMRDAFEKKNRLRIVDGNQLIEKVTKDIFDLIKPYI